MPDSQDKVSPDEVLRTFFEHIDSVAAPHEAVPPSRQNGLCVPQRKYIKGAGRNGAGIIVGLVPFFLRDGSYIKVPAALREEYTGLVNRDVQPLGGSNYTVTIRIEWPGYAPQDFQMRVRDWCSTPNNIPLEKLATEVSKIVQKFVERVQGHTIAPEHAQWTVGPGGIEAKDLRIAALEQVSTGSWQPRLFYKPN